MKSETPKQKKAEDKAIEAIAAFLRAHGWNPLVGGFSGVEQGSAKFNFRLVFGFTGKPPKEVLDRIQ